jgi:large subunit ribosomal protein L3
MGAERVTTQNLKIIKTDIENNIILIKGSIPGCKNGYVIIKKAKKKVAKANKPNNQIVKKAKK